MQIIYYLIPLYFILFSCGIILLLTTMLFHPKKPIHILGWGIQGFIPASLPNFTISLKNQIPNLLPSFQSIEEKLLQPENFEKIMPMIEEHIDDFLRNKLSESMPMISMFIGDRTINQLKELFMKELTVIFPATIQSYIRGAGASLYPASLITDEMLQKAVSVVEKNLYQILKSKKQYLIFLFALIGFVAGLLLDLLLIII